MRFTYKDYRAAPTQSLTTMTLAATEFIRRFVLHVLPLGFHRIRYDGFLGPRRRAEKLTRCSQLLASTPSLAPPMSTANVTVDHARLAGSSRRLCPACGQGQLVVIDHLPPPRQSAVIPDTS